MTLVELKQISKRYHGEATSAVDQISLTIPSGTIVALLGMSGSGKTTLLKIIAGLLEPSAGDVCFDGVSVLHLPTERRGAIMVFQNHLLFPHMTVEQNIGFGLKMQGVQRGIIAERVAAMLALIQLPALGKRKPVQLSGGQQQRVALARALIVEPRLLLLDEPLSNLDANLRDEMRELILQVQRHFGITTLVVTHDQQDAVLLADHIALMRGGQLQQFGTPDALFYRPADEQVARFFGGVNFLPGAIDQQAIRTSIGTFSVPVNGMSGRAVLTIRPEQIQFCEQNTGVNTVTGLIEHCQFMGTHYRHAVRVENLSTLLIVHSHTQVTAGTIVGVHLPPGHIWLIKPSAYA